MRLFFVGMMTVLAVGFVSSAWAAEVPVAEEGTPQERCDAAGVVVTTADADLETVEKELASVEMQLVALRAQKKELTAQRDTIRKTRTGKRVVVKKAQRSERQACKQVIRCKDTNEKVLTSKKTMDGLVKELSEVKRQTGAHKKATAQLLGKFEALEKQEGELQCRKLKGKGGEPNAVNTCHDTYETYGELKKELAGKRKELQVTDKIYKKLASKNKRKQSELKYLGRRIRQNCAAKGPEIQEVAQLEAQQAQYDEVAAELSQCNVDVQSARKIKIKKPKVKRMDANVKFAAKAKAKAKVEAKGSTKKKPAKKSKKKVKAKSTFEIGGEASAKAKVNFTAN